MLSRFASRALTNVYELRTNWCGFGDLFPTGDMQLDMKQIASVKEYPCQRARIVEGESVVSKAGV
jgi:hypothetical protein